MPHSRAGEKLNGAMQVHMPFAADTQVPQFNPLGKVPVLVTDDGRKLFDSRVSCEYFDGIAPTPRYLPENFDERIAVRRWEALADGVADAVLCAHLRRSAAPFAGAPMVLMQGYL